MREVREGTPQYKIIDRGKMALDDVELVAIVLSHGYPCESDHQMAQRLLERIPIAELDQISLAELMTIKGITPLRAARFVASAELVRRIRFSRSKEKGSRIHQASDVVKILYEKISPTHESFWCVMLNSQNRIIEIFMVSQGGLAGTVADPRIMLRRALIVRATSTILVHNHPSGNTQPSDADKALTKKMVHAGTAMDIQVVDHIILGNDYESYLSMAEAGMM
jgi:DNA repair protein RadC